MSAVAKKPRTKSKATTAETLTRMPRTPRADAFEALLAEQRRQLAYAANDLNQLFPDGDMTHHALNELRCILLTLAASTTRMEDFVSVIMSADEALHAPIEGQ